MSIYKLIDYLLMNDFSKDIAKYFNKKDKNIVFDVGSYRGSFTKRLSQKLPNSIFYLFDPQYLFNTKLYSSKKRNIKCFPIAFYSSISKKKIYINNFLASSGTGIDSPTYNDFLWNFSRKLFLFSLNKNYSQRIIKTTTIDSFVRTHKIKKIDILKIDVEGSEFDVLKGAKRTLIKSKIIQLEIITNKNNFNSKYSSIIKYLKKYDFVILKELNIPSTSLLSNIKSVDIIFIKKKFRDLKKFDK